MSATAAERQQFGVALGRALPGVSNLGDDARKLLFYAARHARLMEDKCNGCGAFDNPHVPIAEARARQDRFERDTERKVEQVEKAIRRICDRLGISVKFEGDPRGFTVKLGLPGVGSNSWGGEGYGIPS